MFLEHSMKNFYGELYGTRNPRSEAEGYQWTRRRWKKLRNYNQYLQDRYTEWHNTGVKPMMNVKTRKWVNRQLSDDERQRYRSAAYDAQKKASKYQVRLNETKVKRDA